MPTSSFDTVIDINKDTVGSLTEIMESEPVKVDLETDVKITKWLGEEK